jgi:glucosamine-6-phosphate deaminase
MTTTTVDRLQVQVYESRAAMGKAAAGHVAALLRTLLAGQDSVRMVFASAPSQNEFLAALATEPAVAWGRVTAFHMDEYLGMPVDAPQSFGRFIREHLLDRVHVGNAHYVDGTAEPDDECRRYAGLLAEAPIDIVCLGIGENGHIAFNDPPYANFDDPRLVKVVELDDRSRHQQVHDGCFPTFDAVPRLALTMTIPALMGGRHLSAVVPAPSKAEAVRATLTGPVTDTCPASVMRRHPQAVLFLDPDSSRLTPLLTGA